jgi:hypothetical protein
MERTDVRRTLGLLKGYLVGFMDFLTACGRFRACEHSNQLAIATSLGRSVVVISETAWNGFIHVRAVGVKRVRSVCAIRVAHEISRNRLQIDVLAARLAILGNRMESPRRTHRVCSSRSLGGYRPRI